MGKSILVFASHSSEDKDEYVVPIVDDLESCYINTWLDQKKILPGENLRKSIFRDGLDKADVVLLFFTQNSLKSSWVDREIKHVLREESKKGNDFDLKKIISIFETKSVYSEIAQRYPELTDDLCHLMPKDYSKIQLGQLISAIWSKYFDLQGGDIASQQLILSKDREIFQKDREILELTQKLERRKNSANDDEYMSILHSGKIDGFLAQRDALLITSAIENTHIENMPEAVAFGFIEFNNSSYSRLSARGRDFIKWVMLQENPATK